MQPLSVVDRVGTGVLGLFEFVGTLAVFGGRAVVEAFRPPYELREITRHLYQFGYRSAPLILTAGFAIGIVLSMHTRASLERFGAEAMIPAGLAIALIRDTGPLTAGLLPDVSADQWEAIRTLNFATGASTRDYGHSRNASRLSGWSHQRRWPAIGPCAMRCGERKRFW